MKNKRKQHTNWISVILITIFYDLFIQTNPSKDISYNQQWLNERLTAVGKLRRNNMIDNVDINKIQKELLEEDTIIDIAELFKVFADSTRVKIINVLLENKLCVSDIATLVGGTQSAISHQLRILKSAKLVKYTKIGKTVYYELSDDHVKKLFNIGKEHINEI